MKSCPWKRFLNLLDKDISRSEIFRKKEKKADQKMKSCPRKRFLNLLDRDISRSEILRKKRKKSGDRS